MEDSILDTIKKMLGIDPSYPAFDTDIIVHINSVLMSLRQMGVGPPGGFQITGDDEEWQDFFGDSLLLEAVKTYIYLKVKSVFDPPQGAGIEDASTRMIQELEWRIYVQASGSFAEEGA